MKETKEIYYCDRCGERIDSIFFDFSHGKFKKTMSATKYEQIKYGYLPDNEIPLPDANVIVLDGICGYCSKEIRKMHFCPSCTKEFKRFMRLK